MSRDKLQNMGWTLKQLIFKIVVMLITVGIGLWCGGKDSYTGFYVAVVVQAINNIYDASAFLENYCRFITIFQVFVLIAATISAVIAVIHFNGGSQVDAIGFVVGIVIALSLPIIHYGIEVYRIIREDRY